MNLLSFSLAPCRMFRLGLFLAFWLVASTAAKAEDLYIVSKLIWGTNKDKVQDLKTVDAATGEKFRNVFAWKHYYEVKRTNVMVKTRSTQQVVMSKKCTIEIKELEGPKVEVTLIGQGKPVVKTIKPLSKGEYVTIAGGSKDDSAWFVAIYQVDAKEFKAEDLKNQLPVVVK